MDNGDVYVLGGGIYKEGVGPSQYRVARYSVADNTWQQLPNITWITWDGAAVFIHNDKLYSAYMHDIWSLELIQTSSGMWTKENIKLPHDAHGQDAVVSVGETVIITGEWPGGNSVISWRPGTGESWRSLSNMNVFRHPHSVCSVTDGVDLIWVMAGCFCSQTGFIEMYQVSTNTWTQLDAVPHYISSNTGQTRADICGYHNGYIYAIFGTSYNGQTTIDERFHIYNTIDNTWIVSDTELTTNALFQAAVVVT